MSSSKTNRCIKMYKKILSKGQSALQLKCLNNDEEVNIDTSVYRWKGITIGKMPMMSPVTKNIISQLSGLQAVSKQPQ